MFILKSIFLEKGDIALSRSDDELSRLIRRLTDSEFSHARLYVGAGSMIESDGYGVQSLNPQRLLFNDLDDIVVLRLKDNSRTDQIHEATVFARQHIGTEYSLAEAKLALINKEVDAVEPNRQFCTRFVAQAYESAGIPLVSNPNYCNPEDILASEVLRIVNEPLREARPEDIEFARSPNPLEKQKEAHKMIFSQARELSGEDIQTFDQLTKYVLDNPEQDYAVAEIVTKSGYLSLWQLDIDNHPEHYDYTLFLESYPDPQHAIGKALWSATTEPDTRWRFEVTLETLLSTTGSRQLRYCSEQIDLCKKLIELSFRRESTARQVLRHHGLRGYK